MYVIHFAWTLLNNLLTDVLPCVVESVELSCITEFVHEHYCGRHIYTSTFPELSYIGAKILLVAAFVHN